MHSLCAGYFYFFFVNVAEGVLYTASRPKGWTLGRTRVGAAPGSGRLTRWLRLPGKEAIQGGDFRLLR